MWYLIISLWLSVYPLITHTAIRNDDATTTQATPETIPQCAPETVLIFISLNLPDHQLKELYQEAKTSKIPTQFFLRELYKGSIRGTTERLKNLKIKAKIDPEWLGCYEIKTVLPTFILLGKEQTPIVLHGAISLEFAIKQMNQPK